MKQSQRMSTLKFAFVLIFHFLVIIYEIKGQKHVCSPLKNLKHGTVKYKRTGKNGKIIFKTRATFKCEPQYKLYPPTKKFICRKYGKHFKWSSEPPQCVGASISCPQPKAPAFGDIIVKSKQVGGKALVKCHKGFRLIGKKRIICQPTGTWSTAKCELKTCKLPPTLHLFKNGDYQNGNLSEFKLDDTITFSCNEKFFMDGPDSMTCQLNRDNEMEWFPRKPPKCYEIRCPNPGFPKNGRRYGSNYKIGAKVKFFCNPGYKLHGSRERTCLEDATWSGSITVCNNQASDCDDPGIPINGRRFGDKFALGSKVRYECRKGSLLGSKIRTCKVNRTWTGYQPVCVDERIPKIPPLEETIDSFKRNFIETLAPASCASNKDGKCNMIKSKGRSFHQKSPGGLDVIFLFDASSSIGKDKFKLALNFACEVIKILGVDHSHGGTRFAAVTYGSKATLAYSLDSQHVDTREKACRATKKIKYSGGGTATRLALSMVNDNIAEKIQNKNVILLVIADGKSNFGGSPLQMARKLEKDYGIIIYAIGVGKKINMKALRMLATEGRDHVFQIHNYKQMETMARELIKIDYSKCGAGRPKRMGRIFGGESSIPAGWPWQVALYRDSAFIGGGSIINKRLILTTAHSFYEKEKLIITANSYRVVAGITKLHTEDVFAWLNDEKTGLRIDKIIMHKNFSKDHYKHDIAIIVLKYPLEWTPSIRPVCLPKRGYFIEKNTFGYAIGWGTTQRRKLSPELKHVRLYVDSNMTCSRSSEEYFQNSQFCARHETGRKDACKGDSGGGFVSEIADDIEENKKSYKVIGLVSWGDECRVKKEIMYGYYTRVNSYLDWIKAIIDMYPV